ncbi:MAG: hypothetical protein IPJ07_17980 [Acidobacteria bacterium]|nr:hypothetical protein [Acidobacteriota bacterium]
MINAGSVIKMPWYLSKIFSYNQGIDRDDLSVEDAIICNTIFRMNRAFKRLVESSIHKDVGEFMIETASSPEGFYHEPSKSFFLVQNIQPVIPATCPEEVFSSIGSFTYSILTPKSAGIGAIGIHFYPGNSGRCFTHLRVIDRLFIAVLVKASLLIKCFRIRKSN